MVGKTLLGTSEGSTTDTFTGTLIDFIRPFPSIRRGP
jgi:hypothetical protein